jgi:predicted PurR-regulated permease PerM
VCAQKGGFQTYFMLRSATGALQPRLLSRIAWLLAAIVLFFILTFCFFGSSFCITAVLAAFLAILVDPLVTHFERWRVPRAASAAVIVVGCMLICCFLAYESYNRISAVVEHMPEYADKIRGVVTPINQKIAKVQETAVTLAPEMSSKKNS